MSLMKNGIKIENIYEYPLAIILEDTIISLKKQNEIYQESNHFEKELKDFCLGKKYNISFAEKDKEYKKIIFQECDSEYKTTREILSSPLTLTFEEENEFKTQNLFNPSCIYYIAENLVEEYELVSNGENSYKIQTTKFSIDKSIKDLYLSSQKYSFEEIKLKKNGNVIEINPKILTPNFYSIFNKSFKNDDLFKIFLSDLRYELIGSIYTFIKSDKRYFWLMGSDGIGKSISLLFISILSCSNYKFIYFNTKLFTNENESNFSKICFNELYKFYFANISEEFEDDQLTQFKYLISKFEALKFNKNKSMSSKFWEFLNFLISNIFVPIIIIIDQYNNDQFDPDYNNFNIFIKEIEKKKLRIQKNKVKIIFSNSINNTDSKFSFIKNLKKIIGTEENNNNDKKELLSKIKINTSILSNNIDIIEDNNEDLFEEFDEEDDKDSDNKEICNYFEKLLTNETKDFNQSFSEISALQSENYPKSNLILDSEYSSVTKKVYISNLVSGKDFLKDIKLTQEEENLAKEFNYNLKYLDEYFTLKEQLKQNNKYKNDDILIREVTKSFYANKIKHFIEKIRKYYYLLFCKKKYEPDNSFIIPYNNLCQMRNNIIEQKKFGIQELAENLEEYPMKYLNVVLIFKEDIENFEFNDFLLFVKFKIEYSCDAVRIAINQIISDFEKVIHINILNRLEGAALGWYLEYRIDDIFKRNYFRFKSKEFEVRNIFSLVGVTNNSENTINIHRKENNNLSHLLKGKNYYDFIIDDIDKDKITRIEYYNLNKKYYYFSQISLKGRSFDMAILERKYDKNNIFILYLFQCSKRKIEKLKSKYNYIEDAGKVAEHLSNLYNIEIEERYLTFIIPYEEQNTQFKEKLIINKLNYITFNFDENLLYDKNNTKIIISLKIEESLLDLKIQKEYYEKYKNKKIFNNLWIGSSKIFLNKKRQSTSFHKIYINKLYNSYDKQNKLILSNKLKEEIINFLEIKDSKLHFFGNCSPNNLIYFSKNYNTIIFFKYEYNWYFYYQNFYRLNEATISNISNEEEEKLKNYIDDKNLQKIDLKEVEQKMKNKNKYLRVIKQKKKESNIIGNENINFNREKSNYISEFKKNIIEFDINDEKLKKLKNSLDCYIYLIIDKNLSKNVFKKITNY